MRVDDDDDEPRHDDQSLRVRHDNIALGGGDADTNYDAAMTGITALMPTPGNGTNKAGDTPQEILFMVTDGVEDENVSGIARNRR